MGSNNIELICSKTHGAPSNIQGQGTVLLLEARRADKSSSDSKAKAKCGGGGGGSGVARRGWWQWDESYSTESVTREPGKQMHVSSRLARPTHEERVC